MSGEFAPLLRLFPANGFRLAMNLQPLAAREYFAPRDETGRRLELRRQLLRDAAEFYRAETEMAGSSIDLLREFLQSAGDLAALSGAWEPDLVLLEPDAAGKWRVAAGCVCFPTMWSLPEKLGQPLGAIHGPVPGLNAQIGQHIDAFLQRLTPGNAFGRANWGLAASEQLDQHPRHYLPEIRAGAALAETWLRIEEQALVRLGERTILFAIRIENHRLDAVREDRELSRRLALALRTMPEEMARYKRLETSRAGLIAALG